jgi:adenylosuccinate lyase
MIDKYQDGEIKEIWSKSRKLWIWETLSLTYLNELLSLKGLTKSPLEPFSIITEKIDRYERETKYELDAFLKELSERLSIFDEICPEVCQHLHYGLADSDITDTALSLQIRMSVNEIISKMTPLQNTLEELMTKTEEVHFGTHFESFKIELDHSTTLLNTAKNSLYGKFTGHVGVSNHISEQAASYTLAKWNLLPVPITNEIIPRFYYTNTMYALVTLASALERIATQIRLMAIKEVNKVQQETLFVSEEISDLARLIKTNFAVILNNNNLWWEKDTSHSSVEQIIWPETFHLVSHVLSAMNNMLINLNLSYAQNPKNSSTGSYKEPLKASSKTSSEEERESTYKVISEADEVFYFEATSADEAELLYNEAYLFPKEPHTHIHKIIKLKEV